MKAHTKTGQKMLNKICLNCKHLMYQIDTDMKENVAVCYKTKKDINEYGTCEEFEFDGDVE